ATPVPQICRAVSVVAYARPRRAQGNFEGTTIEGFFGAAESSLCADGGIEHKFCYTGRGTAYYWLAKQATDSLCPYMFLLGRNAKITHTVCLSGMRARCRFVYGKMPAMRIIQQHGGGSYPR